MKLQNFSIGKKLGIGFGLMLLTTGALAIASLYAISSLGHEFDETASRTAKKVDLVGSIAENTSEMASLQRGMLLRVASNDLPPAEAYHNSFEERASS